MSPRGRPRSLGADAAIERAVRELIDELGYDDLSMQRVADRAGVARATVYRRAPDKASLVFEALFGEPPPPVSGGDDWEDRLRTLVTALSAAFAVGRNRAAMPGLFAEFTTRPALAERVRSQLLEPAYAAVRALAIEGQQTGHVRTGLDLDLWVDMLFGAVFVRSLVFGRPVGPAVIDALVGMGASAAIAVSGHPVPVRGARTGGASGTTAGARPTTSTLGCATSPKESSVSSSALAKPAKNRKRSDKGSRR